VAHSMPALGITVAIWTLGEMVAAPVSYAYVAEIAPEHMRGRYQGLYGVTFGSGAIFGPALGTLLYAHVEARIWGLCGVLGLAAALLIMAGRPATHGHTAGSPDGVSSEMVILTEPAPADEITMILPDPDVIAREDR
jgi:MFS family permease